MFAGIIEDLGSVKKIEASKGNRVFTIESWKIIESSKVGDSISVNGVCLTVTEIKNNCFVFEAIFETFNKTNLKFLKVSDKVNLERSLKADTRISGHLVSGHIDGMGVIRRDTFSIGSRKFEIAVDKDLITFIVPKGSIAVDGISLTIGEVKGNIFSVYIIPHTLKNTTLGFKGPSSFVNIEVDMLAKYTISFLKGFRRGN